MKVLFVDNLLLPEKGNLDKLDVHPHLGLLSLIAVAKQAGYEASIIDPKWYILKRELDYDESLYERFSETLLAHNPDVVGFTTLGCSFIFALSVAEILKEKNPRLPIILGGPHASILHEELLKNFPFFDLVVRNEAENTLIPVLEGVKSMNFSGISGVTWRNGNHIIINSGKPTVEDLDTLIMPAYDEYPIKDLKLEYLRVDAGRGCPFKCTFCSTASFFGRIYRLKSPAKLIGELDELNEKFGITDFKLNHDLFTVNRKKVIAFCKAIRTKGYTWGVSARIDCVDEELLNHMWEAGCRGIYFGLETGSERMQQISEKKLNINLVDPILDITERLGMRTIVSFISGYPQETEEDQNQTLDMLGKCFKRNRILFSTQLHMLTPEPGTGLDKEFGNDLQYDGYQTDFNALSLSRKDEDVINKYPNIFMTYHYYPTILPRNRHIFAIEAYRKLRKCGHTILSYLLRYYNGRFSLLIRDFEDWFYPRFDKEISVKNVIGFISDKFGESHHVTSLIRYSLLTIRSQINITKEDAPQSNLFDPFMKYQLGNDIYLFKNLHSCSHLIKKIHENINSLETFSNEEIGDLGYYIVIAKSKNENGIMINYEVNEATYLISQLYKKPLSYFDLVELLKPISLINLPEMEMIKGLVAIGALQQANVLKPQKIVL